jgi:serine/threonine protein phosphatase PrpC
MIILEYSFAKLMERAKTGEMKMLHSIPSRTPSKNNTMSKKNTITVSSSPITLSMKFYNQPYHIKEAIEQKEREQQKAFGIQFKLQGVKEDTEPTDSSSVELDYSPFADDYSPPFNNEHLPTIQHGNQEKKEGLFTTNVFDYSLDTPKLIHFVNGLNNKEDDQTSIKTGHLLIAYSMAIAELINRRPSQGDSGCMNKLEGLPMEELAIREILRQQFENANKHLEQNKETATSGTTFERVVIDTRTKGIIRVFTVKAGDGDVFLVSKKDKENLQVQQADWRDQPDAKMEKERIIAAGGLQEISDDYRIARIEGLSVSAGLGDFYRKYIRRTPRIKCFEYKVNEQNQCDLKAVIVNCDGITEKQSIEETKKLIASLMDSTEKMERQPQEIAEELAFKALEFSEDNLSAGVIMIAPLLEQGPGVYELIICDGHGLNRTLVSYTVCEYHTNNCFSFEMIQGQQKLSNPLLDNHSDQEVGTSTADLYKSGLFSTSASSSSSSLSSMTTGNSSSASSTSSSTIILPGTSYT